MKRVHFIYCLLLFVFCFFAQKQCRAFDGFPISYLGIEQGLSNNAVRCIYQDHSGFMWFGTYDGLNRYDGYSFKVFRNKFNDSSSLINNWITAITEDNRYNIWIGTRQGISLYNPLSSKLASIYYHSFEGSNIEKLSVQAMAIATTSENILVGTEGQGLLLCNQGETILTQIALQDKNGTTVNYSVAAIKSDIKGRIWLFIIGKGLCLYDQHSKIIQVINTVVKEASCMEADGEGNIWIGTANGLFLYNIGTNSFIKHLVEGPGMLSENKVVNLYLDGTKNLWISTDGGGITIMATLSGKARYLLPGNTKQSLTSEAVYAVYEDKQGRKWIGTLRGGINVIDPNKSRFQTISYDPVNPNGLIGNFILSFCEARDGSLWIGTDGSGLSVWDRKNNKFTNYRRNFSELNSLSNNFITCIKEDFKDQVWIATYGGGVNRFNRPANSFVHYQFKNEQEELEDKNIWLLYEDKDKDLWAGCVGGAAYILNRASDQFEVFDNGLRNLLTLSEDRTGNLWGGDFNHLIKIDKKNKKYTFYLIEKPVRAIYEDRSGRFWVGTEGGGLLLFDKKTGKFLRFTDADGLCNNSILNILEDDDGNIWLSTFDGISKFYIADKTFKNFYQNDGLQSNQFNYNAAIKLKTGEFMFGGIKGFNIFYPSSVVSSNNHPSFLLTGLRVNYNEVDKYSRFVVKTSDDHIRSIRIPYNQAVLSFDFAALEFSAADKISYGYYLEGWDKDWNYGKSRTANYSNLTEGNYTLWIKSTDADGNWMKQQESLQITVLPPIYRAWWAYMIYILFAASIIYGYNYYRNRQNKLRYELKLVQIHADKERELNEKRLSFFTNISHEFRTPLTLIINPIKDLLKRSEKPEEHSELNIVNRNAKRLLSLIDQLLIFRKADVEADNMKFSKHNFYDLCNEVYLCFVQQAKSNHQQYIFECNNKELCLYVDREKIEIALYNLISNAIKFTPPEGKIIFRVQDDGNDVQISVIDNGYGIPKEAVSRLFEKFYQAKSENAPAKSGFGIGLYLVKHFVEGHKGEVTFESEEGKGTSFFVTLKTGKDHLSGQRIYNDSSDQMIYLEELEEEVQYSTKESEQDEILTDRQTILVVDDDKSIRQYLLQVLKDKYETLEAVDGNEALKITQKKFPDLVISDIRMHGMDGIDLCKNIKADPSLNHIPVILLTGSFAQDVELQSLEGGADAYITKPFDKEILLARVQNIFNSRNELQKYFFNEITLQKSTLKISSEYKEFLDKCIAIVEDHLDDDDFSIKKLSAAIGMSHSNLYKKVKSISGQSITGFIRFIRLRKAAELLIKTDCNVNQAAFQVGISDIKYFRVHFNKLFGMNPSDYIKKYRQPFDKSYQLSSSALKEQNLN